MDQGELRATAAARSGTPYGRAAWAPVRADQTPGAQGRSSAGRSTLHPWGLARFPFGWDEGRRDDQPRQVLPGDIGTSRMVTALCAARFIRSMEQGDERSDIPLCRITLGVDETCRRCAQVVDKRDPVGVPLAINIVRVDWVGADSRPVWIDLVAAHRTDQHLVSIFGGKIAVKPPPPHAGSQLSARDSPVPNDSQADKSAGSAEHPSRTRGACAERHTLREPPSARRAAGQRSNRPQVRYRPREPVRNPGPGN